MINLVTFFASVLVFSLGVRALGSGVLWWFQIRSQTPLSILAWGIGMSMLTQILTLLALSGHYRPEILWWVWVGLLAIGSLYSLFLLQHITIKRTPTERNPDWILLISQIGTYVMLALCFMTVMTPETRHDPYDYHLMIPTLYLQAGGIVEIPWHVFSYMPKNTELLYGLALAVGHDAIAKLIHFMFGCFGLLVISEWVQMGIKRNGVWLGKFLIATLPLFGFIATSAYIDLALGFWQLMALYCLAKMYDPKNEIHTSVLYCFSAWFAGMALGTKYTAYAVFFPAYLLCALYSLKQVRYKFFTLLFAVMLIPLPAIAWWSANAIWTLNPLYPLLPQFFGYRSPAAMDAYAFFRGHAPGAEVYQLENILPYLGMRLNHFLLDGNAVFLIGLGGVLLYPVLARKKEDFQRVPFQRGLLLFILISTITFFFATDNHDGRFFYATLALLTIPGIQLILYIHQLAIERSSLGWVMVPLILVFFFANGISYRFGQLTDQRETIFPILTNDMRDDWLRNHFPDYPILTWGNTHLPADAVVLGMGYPLQRMFITKNKYGYIPGWDEDAETAPPDEVIKKLRTIGVTHFILPNPFFRFPENFTSEELHTLFQHRGKTAYQIKP